MFKLPKPVTFEDGQRQFFGVAMVCAGIFAGVVSLGLIGLFYGVATNYPLMMKLCLQIIGGGFAGFLISMIIVIVALAVGGPVGRLKFNAGKAGVGMEMAGDGEAVEQSTPQTCEPTRDAYPFE